MGNLSEYLHQTIDKIDDKYEADYEPRGRLGLSQCGHECPRFLWYKHHAIAGNPPKGRVLRLFQLGHLIEEQVIADLKASGINHHSDQKEVTFTQDDIILIGHIDGIVEGLKEAPKTPHLFECKSASLKRFNNLLKLGSYKEWSETYYWQIQFYMLGLDLKRAFVVVYCKDDSRLYQERIKLDREGTIRKLEAVFAAITSESPPMKACPNENWYKAKWCDYYDECFPC